MKKKESFKKGIISLLFSQILIKTMGLAYKLYLTNRENFGDKGNAIYSSGFQIYALLLCVSSIGVPNAIAKLVSERLAIGDTRGAHKVFKIAFYTFAFIGLIGTLFLFFGAKVIAIKVLQIPEAEYCLIALSPSIFFVAITSVFRGYFNGREQLSATARSQSVEQISKAILTIILVEVIAKITDENTNLMAGVANLATAIATFISFFYIYVYYKIKTKEINQEIKMSVNYIPTRISLILKQIFIVATPMALSSLMSAFNKNIDLFTVIRGLKHFMPENQAKIQYGILSGKIDTICLLPLSLNIPFATAIVPNIAKSMALKKYEEVSEKILKFLQISILIGLPSTVSLCLFAKPILNLLFPNANSGVVLLQINSISIIFAVIAQTINGVLQGIGKNNIPAISFLIGMGVKFIINITLVRKENLGINAAALGNIVCNFIVCLIGFIVIIKKINLKIDIKKIIFKPIIANFVMAMLSIATYMYISRINTSKLAIILAIAVAMVTYFLSIISLKIVSIGGYFNKNFKKIKIF